MKINELNTILIFFDLIFENNNIIQVINFDILLKLNIIL